MRSEIAPKTPLRRWSQEFALTERLLAQHLSGAVQRLGGGALGVVDLPPLTEHLIDDSQLRAAAALWWAREVDAAGILRFVDTFAERVVHGTLLLPIRTSAEKIARYHRRNRDRFDAAERGALYLQTFGEEGTGEFAAAWRDLTSTMERVARGAVGLGARVSAAAAFVAAWLSGHAAGMAAFAAREIVEHVRDALDLLADAELQRLLGSRDPWRVLRIHGKTVVGEPLQPRRNLVRAVVGRDLMTWLADHAAALRSAAPLELAATDPAVMAALALRQEEADA